MPENPEQESASGFRKSIPSAWEEVVPYYNHSKLQYVNEITREAGSHHQLFPMVEQLPQDNSEHFFSEYIVNVQPLKQKYDLQDRCLCQQCRLVPTPGPPQQNNQQTNVNITTTTPTHTQPTPTPTQAQPPPPVKPPSTIARTTTSPADKNSDNNTPQTSTPAFIEQRPILPQQQQQQQQQPTQQHIQCHHYPVGASFLPPTTPMIMPFIFPYPWMVATTAQPAVEHSAATACWGRHAEWLMEVKRVGRPPHDYHCPVRCGSRARNLKGNSKNC